MNTQENQVIEPQDTESQIDIRRLLARAIANWYWIALSALLCVTIGYLYARYTTPVYKINARILVHDQDQQGGMTGVSNVVGDLSGLLGAKSTVDNEAEIFKTRFLMEKVVKDMDLNITYYYNGKIKEVELYASPIIVQPVKALDTILGAHVEVEVLKNNQILVKGDDGNITTGFDKTFNLPGVGQLQLKRNFAVPIQKVGTYSFTMVSVKSKASDLMKNLSVAVSNKLVTIIDLSLNHPVPKKGEDILNRIIVNYVQGNLEDKNSVADSTIKFIKTRLEVIGDELAGLEGNIQVFKQDNNIADMSEQGKLLVATSGQFVVDLAKVETQISILKSLESYLKDDNVQRVLPSSLMPEDLVFSGLIEKYNSLLLEKDRRLISSTQNNPVIINLDEQIANLRKNMLSNLISTKNSLQISKNRISNQMSQAEGKIKAVPKTERNYLSLARQQQIKQELYIFLMQKSEETAISKTSNISNSRTIDPPAADVMAFSPKKRVIYLAALFCGLLIPFVILYLKELFNTKVQDKDDITKRTNVPILGEISHNDQKDNLVVANNSRSAIAEQFRALRTNLSFTLNDGNAKVILLTSSMPAEGKSFTAINLGNILALSGKKVVLMELDLRKPGLSSKLNANNNSGFTNYVISPELKADDIIKSVDINESLFIINSGPIPPNPAEILMNKRTSQLIEELKDKFDYIVIDAPPIGVVTDAQLLAPYADICLYVVRQKFTFKKQLMIVDELYTGKKMKNLGIVVNDILDDSNFGYGYGYAYGTYGEEIEKKSFWQRFK